MSVNSHKQPTLFVIAGPNGAGKSSGSSSILAPYGLKAFDWDYEFYSKWTELSSDPLVIEGVRQYASQLFIKKFEEAIAKKSNFAFETNFHIDDHIEWLYKAHKHQFKIVMIFFYLPDVKICIKRVALRKSTGGHFVPNDEIQLRYANGLLNLKKHYPLFNEIILIDTALNYTLDFIATITLGEVKYINTNYKHLDSISKYIPALSNY